MIRPFQVGDSLLIQRLSRQATRLNTIHALLQPHAALKAALTAVIPWNEAKVATYVLQQRHHELARTGFLQAQKRPGRPEVDIIMLAPALDTAWGHPAVWEKLLSHYSNEAAQQKITRIYLDAPDQPLPVTTFTHVGFRVYTRQTIWRLNSLHVPTFTPSTVGSIRLQTQQDEWALQRLYARMSPIHVQQAEGMQAGNTVKSPILAWWQTNIRKSFILEKQGDIQGCIRIAYGQRGIWLQLWVDTQQPENEAIHQLIGWGLTVIHQDGIHLPVYIGVREYHGGLGPVLADYGFAPFTDRAKMVKHLVQWVRSPAPLLAPALETIREAVPTPFVFPEETSRLNYQMAAQPQPQPATQQEIV